MAFDERPFDKVPREGVGYTTESCVNPRPTGLRLLHQAAPQMIPWAWGMNGALSVLGATLAIFIAMNWGFSVTLSIAALVYGSAAVVLSTIKSV